jgi:hypothetical protein
VPWSNTDANILGLFHYEAQPSVVGAPIEGVMDIDNAVTGAHIITDRQQWVGRALDNLPLNHNISLPAPAAIRIRVHFENASTGAVISPTFVQTINLDTTSHTHRPSIAPQAGEVTINHIYHHYMPLADGTYQLQVDCTYLAGSNLVSTGRSIRLATEIRVNGQIALLAKTLSPVITAQPEGVMITKTAMTPLGNPPGVDLTMYAVDAANTSLVLSPATIETFIDANINNMFP